MSNCLQCVHLHEDPVDGGCDAYRIIPHDIMSSRVSHDTVRGDELTPVAYEPKP